MKTETTVLGTAGLVAINKLSTDKPIDSKFVLGVVVFALMLSILTEVNTPLAEQLGTLVFVTAALVYGPGAAKGLGFTK